MAVGVTALAAVLLLVLWLAVDVLLLIFSAILLAVLLRAPADLLARHTRLSEGWALTGVVVLLLLVVGVAGWLWAPNLKAQVGEFQQRLPETLRGVEQTLSRTQLGRLVLAALGQEEQGLSVAEWLRQQSLAAPLRVLTALLTILFVGLFFAANPGLYQRGVVALVPLPRRARCRELLQQLAHTLRWFLIGRAVAMLFVGVLTGVALRLLGIPQSLLLGLLIGLMTFVPYLGPILGTLPVAGVALLQAPEQLVWAVVAYSAIQLFEGYLLTPLIQQRVVALPPALTLLSQVLMGLLLGGLGVALAAPLAAVLMVAVRMLYVEDVLGDRS